MLHVILHELALDAITATAVFAMMDSDRAKSWINKFHYCLNWMNVSESDGQVTVLKDSNPYSFLFCYSRNDGFEYTIALIYNESNDSWGTHS